MHSEMSELRHEHWEDDLLPPPKGHHPRKSERPSAFREGQCYEHWARMRH